MLAVSTAKLRKSYGDFECLREIDLEIAQGGVFGLLGANGAGKSTLLRTLLGFLKLSSGEATVCGCNVATESLQVRSKTAYLPGDPRLYPTLKGRALLRLFSSLHPCAVFEDGCRAAEKLELDLARRVMFMSTGMRQKLALSIIFGCRAPLVMLDEPTANLDPNVRATVLELIKEVRKDGRTVVLSSHIFSDIDETCDEVAILRGGRIVAQQTTSGLGDKHVVRCRWPEFSQRETQLLNESPQVEHWQAVDKGPAADARELLVTLQGGTERWLGWLATSLLLVILSVLTRQIGVALLDEGLQHQVQFQHAPTTVPAHAVVVFHSIHGRSISG